MGVGGRPGRVGEGDSQRPDGDSNSFKLLTGKVFDFSDEFIAVFLIKLEKSDMKSLKTCTYPHKYLLF